MTDAQKIVDGVTEEWSLIAKRNILEASIQKEKADRLEQEIESLRETIIESRRRIDVLEKEAAGSQDDK